MRILLALFLMFPILSHGQWYNIDYTENYRFVSVGLDPAMALYGSEKNSTGFDGVAKIAASHGNVRVGVFYERFELISYQSWGIQPSYVMYPFRNVTALVGTELSMICRRRYARPSYAFNAELEYHFPRWFLFAKADLKRRTDISQDWSYSNYVGIGFKF